MLHKSLVNNIDDFACTSEISIRESMARITGKNSLFQVVIDVEKKILGTLTDGDIRRAILRGVTLDDPVHTCMNATPITGQVGEEEENVRKLEQIYQAAGARATFLPVIDQNMHLVDILIYETAREQPPRALIMAGGLGSRLGERTKSTPKPLLPVAGRPILDHILERLENAEIEEVYISAHYLAGKIEEFVKSRKSKANIIVLHETDPLGTAGSISLLPNFLNEPFLTLNGDVLTQVDYGALFSFHDRHEYDATIAVAQHRSEIPFGVVRHSEDGLFIGIDEKPSQECFIAAGIYFLSPEFRSLVPTNERTDMPTLLNKARKLGFKIGLFPIHEYWTDIGHPEDFEQANDKHVN